MTITVTLPPEWETPAQVAAQVQGKDMAAFLLDSVLLRLRPDILAPAEATLLGEINTAPDPAVREERDTLLAMQAARPLTPDEADRLRDLIDAVEMAHARRWQCLAALARLRGVSIA